MAGSSTIKVLANGAQLLRELATSGPLSVADLAATLELPRPSVYRLAEALEVIGVVSLSEGGQVDLGVELLHLADAAQRADPLVTAARSPLRVLRDATGQTAYLCALRQGVTTCVDWVQGAGLSLLILSPGRTLPPFAGAASRVMTAFDDGILEVALAQAPFAQLTDQTITTRAQLLADVENTRKRGYCVSDQDVTPGIAAVGVPIFGADGALVGAVSVAGLRDEIVENVFDLVEALHSCSSEVGAAI